MIILICTFKINISILLFNKLTKCIEKKFIR